MAGRKVHDGFSKHLNIVDRAIGVFAPKTMYERAKYRHVMATTDGFDAARSSRMKRRYSGSGGSADRHQNPYTLHQLREQCMAHDRDSALMSGLLNSAGDEIVGPEFTFKPTSKSESFNTAAKGWINERMKKENYDYNRELSFTAALKLTLRAVWTSGDILNVFVKGGRTQTFEAYQLATPRQQSPTPDAPKIINGVQRKNGKPIGYYVRREKKSELGFVPSLSDTERIPASVCRFPKYHKRYNATRGIPFISAVLQLYDRFDGYLDAETFNAELSSKLGFQITRNPDNLGGSPFLGGTESRTDPNATNNSDKTFDKLLRMETGSIFDLEPGEEIKNIGGHRPTDNFTPYTMMACRIIGVGVGFPLELFLKDFSKTNFSASKAALGLARRTFRGWQVFLRDVECTPWYR